MSTRGRRVAGMTIVRERRSDGNVLAGFLVIVLAIAVWRGASAAPVIAALLGLLAVGTIAGWVYWRRRPPSELTVSEQEITFGSPTRVVTRIDRGAGGTLEFSRSAARQTGWFLRQADTPGSAISMIGFDMDAVGRVCGEHGWSFR